LRLRGESHNAIKLTRSIGAGTVSVPGAEASARPRRGKPPCPETHVVKFGKFSVRRPALHDENGEMSLYPRDARLANNSYLGAMYITMEHSVFNADNLLVLPVKKPIDIFIGTLPIMTRSAACNLLGLDDYHARMIARAATATNDGTRAEYTARATAIAAAIAAGPASPEYAREMDRKLESLDECTADRGGYFIIKGTERAIICQESMTRNHVFVQRGRTPKTPFVAEIFSAPPGRYTSNSVQLLWHERGKSAGEIFVEATPHLRDAVPFALLMRAFGATDADIRSSVLLGNAALAPYLSKSLAHTENAVDFIAHIAQHDNDPPPVREAFVNETLTDMLRHVPQGAGAGGRAHTTRNVDNRAHKTRVLGYMAHRLLRVVAGQAEPDDRDHIGAKSIDTAGTLIGQLFDRNLGAMVRSAHANMVRNRPLTSLAPLRSANSERGPVYRLLRPLTHLKLNRCVRSTRGAHRCSTSPFRATLRRACRASSRAQWRRATGAARASA
jgi:DNA-directed RNA polymerase subunit B"